jgi:C4-dicarboxylate-specific signal transduction histidine kinase/HAMP domain-containing protein/ActR/RegA family two-component response regulator
MPSSRSLRVTLVSLILLAILPGVILLVYSDLDEIRSIDQQLDEDARRFARLGALRQRTLIASEQRVLVTVSQLAEVRSLDPKRCGDLMADLSRHHPVSANLGAVDLSGRLRCSAVPTLLGINLADRQYVRDALIGHHLSAGQFVIDRVTKNATLNYGYPIVDDQTPVGAAFIAIDLRSLNDFGDQALLPEGARLYLLDPTGVILRVAPEHRELIGQPIRTALPAFAGAGDTARALDAGGDHVVIGRSRVDSLSVICVIPEKGALANARKRTFIGLIGTLVVAILGFCAAWLIAGRKLLAPIKGLVRATQRVSAGDLDTRLNAPWTGELGVLAGAFDDMVGQLRDRQAVLLLHQHSIEMQARRLGALHLLDREILAGGGPETVLQPVVPHLKESTGAERLSLVLWDGETASMCWVESDPVLGPSAIGPLAPEHFAPVESLGMKPRYFPDLSVERELAPAFAKARDRGIRTLLFLPLVADSILLGWVALSSRAVDAFSESGQQVAREIGAQLAIAVQQTGLRQSLQRERKWLQTIVRHLPEGVGLLAADGRVLIGNAAFDNALSALGHAADEPLTQLHGHTFEQLKETSASGVWTEIVIEQARRLEFEAFVTNANSGADQTVVVLREITAERDVRRQLERQERLAAIGQMAAGIAHDFNNVLFAIMTNTEVLIRDERLPAALVDRARSIAEMARRGAGIIRQILDFSRKSVSARRPLDLSEFVSETMRLLRRAVPQNVALRFTPPGGKCGVLADPARLEQLLTNLVVNARDAMPDGGNITVSISRRLATDNRTNQPGQWISMEVKDSGPGIPYELQKRVFEPYFTTKGADQGTGLGLAQVLGIVQDHGGQIALQSDAGGTAFTILFPAIEAQPLVAEMEESVAARGSGELILLAEDEEGVREPLRDALELLGYRVVAATNGIEALTLFNEYANEVRVIVTDAVMPHMGGLELTRILRDRNPSIGTVIMSGTEETTRRAASWGAPILQKPFALPLLARAIRDAMTSTKENARDSE